MPTPAPLSAEQSASYADSMRELVGLFCDSLDELGQFRAIDSSELPPRAARLLAHHGHMTVTLEEFYEGPVQLHVRSEHSTSTSYARNSLLGRRIDGHIVQFGIMQIDLDGLKPEVRDEIEQHSGPLGRILIKHKLMREVELLALWRIEAGDVLAEALDVEQGSIVFGRTAVIRVAGEPRVDLLEIVNAMA